MILPVMRCVEQNSSLPITCHLTGCDAIKLDERQRDLNFELAVKRIMFNYSLALQVYDHIFVNKLQLPSTSLFPVFIYFAVSLAISCRPQQF